MKSKVKRLTALLLSLMLLMSIVPFSALAEGTESKPVKEISGTIVNSTYRCLEDTSLLSDSDSKVSLFKDSFNSNVELFNAYKEFHISNGNAFKYIRENLVKKQASISLILIFEAPVYEEELVSYIESEFYSAAFGHSGNPKEGEYLGYQIAYCDYTAAYNGYWDIEGYYHEYVVTYNVEYMTTLAQEEKIDAKVEDILTSINTDGSDYSTVKQVYDYVCENVTYIDDLNTASYSTAYSAFINKKANSFGISLMMCRILNELDINCRLVDGWYGTHTDANIHSWNAVEIGNYHYLCDASLDSKNVNDYKWFMLGNDTFDKHDPYTPYYDDGMLWLVVSDKNYVQDAPTLKGSVNSSSGYPELSWTKNANAVKYNVYRSTTGKPGSYTLLKTTSSTSYTHSSAEGGKTYYYRVCIVYDNGDLGDMSNAVKLTAYSKTLVIKSGYDETTGYPKVSWGPIPGVKEYKARAFVDGYNGVEYYDYITTADTSCVFEATREGIEFTIDVCGILEDGSRTSYSNKVEIVSKHPMPVLEITYSPSNNKPRIRWREDTPPEYYAIYRSETENGSYRLIAEVPNTEYNLNTLRYTYVDTSATVGKTYYYKAQAMDIMDEYSPDTNSFLSKSYKYGAPDTPVVSLSTVSSTGKPKISWVSSDDATQYKIYRSTTNKDGSFSLIKTTTSTSLVDTSAVAGTKYYYKVKAINEAQNTSSSFNAAKYITCDLPVVTPSLSINTTSGKPVIKWNAVDGAVSYKVAYCTTKDGEYKLLKDTTSTSVTHTSAVAGTKYYYKVRAIHSNSAANGAYCTAKYTTCDLPKPTMTLSVNSSTGKPVISWNSVDGAVSYKVVYCTTKDGEYKLLKDTTATSVTHTSAVAGTKYYYQVRAIHSNSAANGAYCTAKYTTCDLPKPTMTLSVNSSTGKPVISWNSVDGAVSYKVAYCTTKDGEYKLLKDTTATSVTHTGAKAGTKYYYQVRAIHSNSAANGAYCTAKYTTCDLPKPTMTPSVNSSTGKPVIKWNAVDGAVSYKVAYCTTKDGEYKLLCDTTSTTVTHTKAVAGTKYYYQVRAIHSNSAANGAYCTAKYTTCDLPKPVMTLSKTSAGKPVISWENVDGAVSYKVAYCTTKDGEYKLLCDTTSTTVTHTKAVAGTKYYYKVRAIHSNSAANGEYCSPKYVTAR